MPNRQNLLDSTSGHLLGDISSSATSARVVTDDGTWPATFPFYVTLGESTTHREIVRVDAIVGDQHTIVRGQLGTSGIVHPEAEPYVLGVNREDISRLLAHLEAAAGGGAHPDLATHDALGLATDAELTAHAGTSHGVTDHGLLTGLGDDDHPQYETSAEAAAKVTAHEAAGDPHPTYHTAAEVAGDIGTHAALPNSHHPQAHAIGGADHTGTLAHTALSSVTADQHHTQAHTDSDHTSASRVTVRKNSGADVGTRPRLNLIEGTNVTLTVADDAGGGEVDVTIAAAGGGGGGTTGTADLDFGAFPGKSDASVDVTGQTSIVAGSIVQAWIRPVATADHTADEHLVEELQVIAGNIVAGTGFTIYGVHSPATNEPLTEDRDRVRAPAGGYGTRLYGVWKVAWRWS